jgi:nucleoid-associated protein YgaU
MRKEVKLGFAIGGVLLAVLFIYVLVISSGPPVTKKDVSLATPELSPAQPAQVQPADKAKASDSSEARKTDPFQSSTPPNQPNQGTGTPKAAGDDRWAKALHTGKLDAGEVPLLMTQTPVEKPSLPAETNGAIAVSDSPAGPSADTSTATPAPETLASQMGVTAPSTAPAGALLAGAVPGAARTHVVQKGESFSTIAAAVYGNAAYYPHLVRANPNIDPKKLRVGMVVNIPDATQVVATRSNSAAVPAGANDATLAGSAGPATPSIDERSQYRVQATDSLYKISLKLYGKSDRVDRIYELNKDLIGANPAHLRAGMVLKLPEPPTATASAR